MVRIIKNLIQKVAGIKIIRNIFRLVNIIVLGIASSNRLFSIIYHFIFFFTYSREQHANIKARYKYYANLSRTNKSRVELRRNIHRIEKGLLMKPMRDVFALNYIEETVDTYIRYVNQYIENDNSVDVGELNWAFDVLNSYFEKVQRNSFLDSVHKRFMSTKYIPNMTTKESSEMLPYYRNLDESQVSYDDFFNLAMKRRSVRWFEQKAVPRELIDKALLVARQSPSACNRLPFEYRVFDEPSLVKKVSNIPFGAAGYSDNIPTIIVLVGKLNYYFSSRDRHVIYIDASLSAMAFMLALETLGLSSSVINWPDFEPVELKMQKELKLGVDERPIMLIAVGYPDKEGKVAYSQKKSLDVLRTYN